jgi:chromosome segregation ATPase
VTVAVGLILLAALVVTGAAISGSWLVVTCAAGLGVLLGAVATRITYSELADSRRAAAADRAAQAKAYLVLADERSAEHASYVSDVRARLAEREHALSELEQAVVNSQSRAAQATRKKNAEGRRAASLQVRLDHAEDRHRGSLLRIAELEQEILTLRSELDSVTAAWHAAEAVRRHA